MEKKKKRPATNRPALSTPPGGGFCLTSECLSRASWSFFPVLWGRAESAAGQSGGLHPQAPADWAVVLGSAVSKSQNLKIWVVNKVVLQRTDPGSFLNWAYFWLFSEHSGGSKLATFFHKGQGKGGKRVSKVALLPILWKRKRVLLPWMLASHLASPSLFYLVLFSRAKWNHLQNAWKRHTLRDTGGRRLTRPG